MAKVLNPNIELVGEHARTLFFSACVKVQKMLDDAEDGVKPLNPEMLHALAAVMDGASGGFDLDGKGDEESDY